jgi:hypothetical protein
VFARFGCKSVQIDAKRGGLSGTIVGTFFEHLGTTVGTSAASFRKWSF